jgi:hypothetical protein
VLVSPRTECVDLDQAIECHGGARGPLEFRCITIGLDLESSLEFRDSALEISFVHFSAQGRQFLYFEDFDVPSEISTLLIINLHSFPPPKAQHRLTAKLPGAKIRLAQSSRITNATAESKPRFRRNL